ncbi:CopD family protein [Luteimonas fraxinea]|uniref:Protoporphyrinogen IX oxidase n=1 Tax=Luteimonas fraxinea TaxID=2901869 RepID=A0ABS8UCF0_9GAMM|nr:CopD family protein [Luteimonas fraxinea]MCD9097185.1 CopD family protein [Luteimonas fraxinea]MCD9126550.1 CopD family protein [Luteimonas fraxinea]UHH09520.1 CopD family protein [Luteimonas fraxinea]
MDYLTLKLLHFMAAATWLTGMVGSGIAIALHDVLASPTGRSLLANLRSWNRWVTSPAMLATLGAGLTIALQAGWLAMSWLRIKLALVCALVILHGWLSRTLHQMARVEPPPTPPGLLRFSAPLVFVIGLAIVLLALTKPF